MLRSFRRVSFFIAGVFLFGALVQVSPQNTANAATTIEFFSMFRSAATQSVMDVHVNKATGDSYVIGWSATPLDANGALTDQYSPGKTYGFLSRIDKNGQRLWTRPLGNIDSDNYPTSIVQDADGFLYVTLQQYYRGASPGANIFVEKWSSNGVRSWQKFIASNLDDYPTGLDISGNYLYLSASTSGSIQPNSGGFDILLMKLSKSNGSTVKTKQFGTAGDDFAYGGVRVLADGSVAVSGSTDGEFVQRGARDDADFFYARYSGDLNSRISLRQWGSVEDDFISDMERMSDGRLVFGGGTRGLIAGTVAKGNLDALVLVTSDTGQLAWTSRMGSAADDYIMSVEQSPVSSNILFFGDTQGVIFSASSGGSDLIGGTLSPNGSLRVSKQMGTSSDDWSSGMSLRSDASPVLVGQTFGSFDNTAANGADGFVWSLGVDIGAIAKYLGTLTSVPNLSLVRDLGALKIPGSLSSPQAAPSSTPKACYEVASVSKILRKDVAICAGLTVKKGTKTYIRLSKKNTPGVCRITKIKRLKVTAAGTCKVKIRATQASGKTKAVWINYKVS